MELIFSELLDFEFSLQGVTPMHAAAYRDHANVVRLLLSKGANPKFSVKSTTAGKLFLYLQV